MESYYIKTTVIERPRPRRIVKFGPEPKQFKKFCCLEPDVSHLARFLAHTWALIDDFVYKNCDGDALMKYPVIQGTKNQLNLRAVGQQPFDQAKIKAAVDKLLKQ